MYFIANFQHLTDQDAKNEIERRHGDFSMMVQADSAESAIDMFRQRLISFRTSSSLFDGRCRIFITQLLEFENFPQEEPVLLNFKSIAGDPVLPFIACVVPTEQSHTCSIHEWVNNQPVTEGQKDNLFMEFD